MKERKLLAYCGGYCGDCMGYRGVIADAAEEFKTVLQSHEFEKTAQCVFPEELKEYDKFFGMLKFMTNLRCPGDCRKRKDTETSCEVRKCCRGKGFYACYECDDFEDCETLQSLFDGLHYDSHIKNLRAIKDRGLEVWLDNK